MKQPPKYIEKLLRRRMKLSNELASVCAKIDRYCEKIGIDIFDRDAALGSDVRIYCELDAGYNGTMRAILRALNGKEKRSEMDEQEGGRAQ